MKQLFIILTCFSLLSCTKNPSSIDKTDPTNKCLVQLTYSSSDSAEARDIALWYEADLVPSEKVVSDVLFKLNYLRCRFSDSISFQSFLPQRFILPWTPTIILVKFDSLTDRKVREKTYTGWDLLPTYARPMKILPFHSSTWAEIEFSSRYNVWRMRDLYSKLPGVEFSEPDARYFFEGTYPIQIGKRNDEISFLFAESYMIMGMKLHYFYFEQDEPRYAGLWYPQQNPEPEWWNDAKAVIDSFFVWGKIK